MAAPYWSINVKSTSDADPLKRHPHTNPLKVRKGIRPGKIVGIHIYFPPGCAGLVGVQIYHRETILCPTDSGEWVVGDDVLWPWKIEWPIYGAGNYIGIRVYNDDDTYEHTIGIGLDHIPLEEMPRTDVILLEILDMLRSIRYILVEWPKGITNHIKRLIPKRL